MIKIVRTDSFDFGMPATSLMDLWSRGVDRTWMSKRAAVLDKEIRSLKPEKGHQFLHLITLGAQDSYGPNRNGDGFNEKRGAFELAERKNGRPIYYDMEGGLVDHHRTFIKHAHVFKHHKNDDPKHAIGTVYAEAYNPEMKRGELIIKVPENEEWMPHLQKLASGEDIPFSMACFSAGTLIRTLNGFKPIEDVIIGDIVYTHSGQWRTVSSVMAREADEYLRISMVSWGREVLEVTNEHPFLAARFEDIPKLSHRDKPVSDAFKRSHRHELSRYLRWTKASELDEGCFLAVPIPRSEGQTPRTDVFWARVMGYYLGDGSLQAEQNDKFSCVLFTLNVNNPGRMEIPLLNESRGDMKWTSCSEAPHPSSPLAVKLSCYGTEVAEQLRLECGHAATKRVPRSVFDMDFESQLHFVCGWFNCDGWQDKHGLHWSSSKRGCALELQLLLAQMGIPSSCARIDHPEDRGIVKSVGAVEYVVNVSNEHSSVFSDFSKASAWNLDQGSKIRPFISGSYLMVPVGEIERVKARTKVYNFSVDADESYTASLLAVHNCKVPYDVCSICGNKAKSRAEYCKHASDNLTEILGDGHQVFVINDRPKFFDISRVFRPADRIAWSLRKVASVGLGRAKSGAELAEEVGLMLPVHMLGDDSPHAAAKIAMARKLADIEKLVDGSARAVDNGARLKGLVAGCPTSNLPPKAMEILRSAKLGDALKGLADAKICLSLKDFMELVMGSKKVDSIAGDIPAAMGMLPGMFSRLLRDGGIEECASDSVYDPMQTAAIPRCIKEVLRALEDGHSMALGPATRRMRVTIIHGETPKLPAAPGKIASTHSSTVDRLAKEYAKYQLSYARAAGDELVNGLTVVRNYFG